MGEEMKIVDESYKNKAYDELSLALQEMERADEEKGKVIKQYVCSGSVREGERILSPPRVLDSGGMREIAEAEKKCEHAQEKFDEALRRYKQLL